MAPLMLLIWDVADAGRRDHEREISARLIQIARFGVAMHEEALVTAASTLFLIGDAPFDWVADPEECAARTRTIAAASPVLASFGVIGPWGDIICLSTDFSPGINLSDRPYVRQALSRDGLAVGSAIVSRITGRVLIPVAQRITSTVLPDGPRRPSVILGSLDLLALARSLVTSANLGTLSADVSVDILDPNGTLLAQWPQVGRAMPTQSPFTQALLSAPEGHTERLASDGSRRMAGFAHDHTRGLVFAASVDRSLVLATAHQRFILALGLAALAALAGLGLAFLVARSLILRPVRILADAAHAVRQGQPLPSRTNKRLPGELEELRLAFMAMTSQIALREARLEEANDELAVANSSLQGLTRTDPLTGLANRRGFDEALASAWVWGQAQDLPVAMLMVDLDHFKLFNDRYGHPAGDACLQMIATVLTDVQQRTTDLPARLGGEEFAVLLPGTDGWGAAVVAERLLTLVRAEAMPHLDNPGGIVTLSIGVATLVPQPGLPMEELVAAADAALYAAKRGGRNRMHGTQPPTRDRVS
ncbi:sensor domain-containing diguanylate cyclase [Humitalea rosea]|nr:sensor domain-containing diguanylate cyclase [Humitalea rosea]